MSTRTLWEVQTAAGAPIRAYDTLARAVADAEAISTPQSEDEPALFPGARVEKVILTETRRQVWPPQLSLVASNSDQRRAG